MKRILVLMEVDSSFLFYKIIEMQYNRLSPTLSTLCICLLLFVFPPFMLLRHINYLQRKNKTHINSLSISQEETHQVRVWLSWKSVGLIIRRS